MKNLKTLVLIAVFTLGFNTIHNPKESIEQIAASLENGLIDENVLHESVNIKSD